MTDETDIKATITVVQIPDNCYVDVRQKSSLLMIHDCKSCNQPFTSSLYIRSTCGDCSQKQYQQIRRDASIGGFFKWLFGG